jgi:2-polyprenyl-3-methyl-5-hydroxy-6-metoxy-1,4-benzoquinol methylase
MKFPIYKNDNKALFEQNLLQQEAATQLKDKISSSTYKRVKNQCFCGRTKSEEELLLAEKDMIGIPLNSVLCPSTGLVCSSDVFDEKSNEQFYIKEYRRLAHFDLTINNYFESQTERGTKFHNLLSEHLKEDKKLKVVEVGCGSGGVLYPFFKKQHECTGFDYNKEYLEFGQSKGLNLKFGDYKNQIEDNSADVLILSHVMEHLLDPAQEVQDMIEKIKPHGFLIIEVPGIHFKYKKVDSPMQHLQIAHVVNYFHKDFLTFFFEQLNMEILYGDERCTFVLKKKEGWKRVANVEVPKNLFYEKSKFIENYIVKTHSSYKNYWRNIIIRLLDSVGLKSAIKSLIKKSNFNI